MTGIKFLPLQIEEIRTHIDKLIDLFNTWKNHTSKLPFSIGIARMLLCPGINRINEAEKYWQYFKSRNISAERFSQRYRNYIEMLESVFG